MAMVTDPRLAFLLLNMYIWTMLYGDRFERFQILCHQAIGPLQEKVEKVGVCSASDALLECLQYYNIERINTLLWRLSTGPHAKVWRPYTHWFRRAYGDYVLSGKTEKRSTIRKV